MLAMIHRMHVPVEASGVRSVEPASNDVIVVIIITQQQQQQQLIFASHTHTHTHGTPEMCTVVIVRYSIIRFGSFKVQVKLKESHPRKLSCTSLSQNVSPSFYMASKSIRLPRPNCTHSTSLLLVS